MSRAEYQQMPARYVITGWRHWTDLLVIQTWIERLRIEAMPKFGANDNNTIWGVGDCPTGADAMARRHLERLGLNYREFKADWDLYGNFAGPRRNMDMIDIINPTTVIAFMAEGATGTPGCAKYAQRVAGVYRIYSRSQHTFAEPGTVDVPPFDWSKLP